MFTPKAKFFLIYTIASFLAILSELIELHVVLDFIFKISGLLVVFFSYLKKTITIDKSYILVFLLLLIFEILILFDIQFFEEMVVVRFITTCVFIVMVKEFFQKKYLKRLLKTMMIYLVLETIVLWYVLSEIGYLSILVIITYLSICISGGLTYVNLMAKNTKKALNLLIGVFLLSTSNVVFAISYYIESSMIYVPLVYLLQVFARYFLYNFMILEERKKITI